jgi:PAS domain S-box-containing protein
MVLRRASVAAVLAVALVAVATVLLAGLGAVHYASQRDRGWARLREDLATHADRLAVGLELPIWNIDRPQIDRILDGLQGVPEIEAAMVAVAGHTQARVRDAQGRLLRLAGPVSPGGLLVERRPITVNGEVVGSLAIHASPRILEQDLRAARSTIVSTIVAVDLLLVLSLYLVIWQTVLKPLRMIERYAGVVSAGTSAQAALPASGFLGELASLRASIAAMVRQLEERCREYRDLIDFSPMGIYRARRDGTVIMANQATARILGYESAEHVIGINIGRDVFADPAERERVAAAILEAGHGTTVVRLRRRDGSPFWAEGWPHVVRDAAGEVSYAETFFHDVTTRKGTQDALAASEERHRLLFEGNPIPMLVSDVDSLGFLAANEAAVRQYGWPRAELLQLSILDLTLPGDEHLDEFLATRHDPRPDLVHVGPRRQRRRDGSVIEVDITDLAIAFGGRAARLALLRDITAERRVAEERERFEESLRRNERMAAMGALVAGVAHEVRTPLFSISASVDALEAELEGRQEFAELAALLRAQVTRLSRLMHDLLEYGKPPMPRLAPAEPGAVARRALRACAPLARTQEVELAEDIPAELPALVIDAGRIEQVLDNLLANALQHSPRGGRVRLAARLEEGPAVEFSVEDEGPGIEASALPRLFEPFFSRRPGGTGLGLPIVQGIVEAHGGSVTAANRDGRGAVFTVRLPLSPAQGEHAH